MGKRNNRRPAALKHGAFCQTDVLPGEDAAAFKKLHEDLVAEFLPHGAVEESIVADLARLLWRKQNMATYQHAALARSRRSEIFRNMDPDEELEVHWPNFLNQPIKSRKAIRAQNEAADEQTREELGEAWDLIAVGEVATPEHLLKELAVIERLDGTIDRALKRLLFVRGIKLHAHASSEERALRSIKAPGAG